MHEKTLALKNRAFLNIVFLALINPFTTTVQAEEFEITDVPLDAESKVTEQIQEFISSSDMLQELRDKYSAAELYVGFGVSSVVVPDGHPKWALYRILAYDQAVTTAMQKYVQSFGLKIQNDRILTLEKDLGINPMAALNEQRSGESRSRRILNKIGAVIEGNIDASLAELGVDPDEFYKAPKKERHVLFKNALVDDTVRKAYHSVKGLMPVVTFEGQGEGEDGSYSVGVVVIKTPGSVAFASKITTSRGQIACNEAPPSTPIKERIKNAHLPYQHGIREIVDDHGCPAIISFGQWSNVKTTRNASLNAQYKSLAFHQARINADNHLIAFVAGQTNVDDSSGIKALYEDFEEVSHTGFITEDQFDQLTERLSIVVKTVAKATLVGVRDLYRWQSQHAYNSTKVLGIVRIWSPAAERAARGVTWVDPKNTPVRVDPVRTAPNKPFSVVKGQERF